MQIDANMVGTTPAGRVAGRAVHVFDRTGRQPRGVVYGVARDGWWSVASRVTYGPKLPEGFWSPELRAADWPATPTWGEVSAGLRTADALRLSERVYERTERPLGAGGAWSLVWRCEWTAHGPDALRRDAVPVPDTRPNPKRQMVFGTLANGLVQADNAKPGVIYRGRGVLDQLQELIAEPLGRVGLGFPESSAPGESDAASKAAVPGWRATGPPPDTALVPVADVHPVEPTLRGFVHAGGPGRCGGLSLERSGGRGVLVCPRDEPTGLGVAPRRAVASPLHRTSVHARPGVARQHVQGAAGVRRLALVSGCA